MDRLLLEVTYTLEDIGIIFGIWQSENSALVIICLANLD